MRLPCLLVLTVLLFSCSTPPEPKPDKEANPIKKQSTLQPGQQLAMHVVEIIKIIRGASGDCGAALRGSLAYIEEHRVSIDKNARLVREKEEHLSAAEQETYRTQVMGLVEEMIGKPQAIMKPFDEKCPVENKKIGKALGLDK